MKLGHKDPTVI